MLVSNFCDQGPPPVFVTDTKTHTNAVASKAADPLQQWCVDAVIYSYSAAPTAGRLTIAIGSTTYLDVDIIIGGPNKLEFEKSIFNPAGTKNEAVTITLYDGGAAIVGKVTARLR